DQLAQAIADKGGRAEVFAGDLASLDGARDLGARIAEGIESGAVLIQNAGLWPTSRVIGADGHEASFVINHLAPLVMLAPLLERKRLGRVMVVSAGLVALGRFDPRRTPSGGDFSLLRTYCNTKLCNAVAMRDLAAAHPELDVVVLHPGVVRTD